MSELNLKQKLIEIRKQVEFLQKKEKAYNYKYVAEDTVLFAIKDTMNELGVLLVPSVKNHSVKEFEYINSKSKTVKENIVSGDMIFTWLDVNSDEKLEVEFALYGQQQDASQAFGSGLTYCNRYFLLKFFQVATNENDPDKVVSAKRKKEDTQPKVKKEDISLTYKKILDLKLSAEDVKKWEDYYKVNSILDLDSEQMQFIIDRFAKRLK